MDDAFVDAEKWDTSIPNHDKNHCWIASAADLLWLGGWGTHYTDPRTGEPYDSEDAIFHKLSWDFTDYGRFVRYSLEWFFTGTYVADQADHMDHRRSFPNS